MADQDNSAATETTDVNAGGPSGDPKSLLIDDDDLEQNPVRDERPSSQEEEDELQEFLDQEDDMIAKESKAKQTEMEDDEEDEDAEDEEEDGEEKDEKSKPDAKKEKSGRTIRDFTDDEESLITKAVALGIANLRDAIDLHDAGRLRKLVERIESPDGRAKQEPADGKAPAQGDSGAQSEKLFKHRLTKEDYPDETIVGFADEVETHLTKTQQELRSQQQLVQYLINQNTAMKVDRMFAKLGDEYTDVFGAGEIDEVTDKQRENRIKVMGRLNALAESTGKSGERKSTKELMQEAVDSLYADRRVAKEKNQVEAQRQKDRRMPKPSSAPVKMTKEQEADRLWKIARQAEMEEVSKARSKFKMRSV